MILFFAKGHVDSDKFIRYCYGCYRNIMSDSGICLPESVEIVRENGKKPRFDFDGVHFNLSHSHGVMMLGISHVPIGVDIEKVRDVDFSKFTFLDAQNREEFFEKWTERESYLKFIGEGLTRFRREIPADAHFEHFDVYDGYHACVCAEEQNIVAYDMDMSAIE